MMPIPISRFRKTLAALALSGLMAACTTAMPTTPDAAPPPVAQLQGYYWVLSAAFDARGQAQTDWQLAGQAPLRLVFHAPERFSVQGLCNALGAAYSLQGTHFTVQSPMATRRACAEPGLMALEQRVGSQITRASTLTFQPADGRHPAPRLTLQFADASRWELTGTPTPATRYGSAPERVFLEVAPERQACSHGVVKDAQCLRVREVRYSENGLKQGTGAWELFYGTIEGWQHQSGMRQVLRLDRFRVANPPADAPSTAYVLDMVVETERVNK